MFQKRYPFKPKRCTIAMKPFRYFMLSRSTQLFCAAVCFTCALSVTASVGANPIVQARELYASGNWETAKEAYENAFKENKSTKADAALGIAGIFWEQGNYANALKWIDTADTLAKNGKRVDLIGQIQFTRGHIYASKGDLKRAAKELNKCQKSKDQTFVILCRIGTRFIRQVRGQSVPSEVVYQKDLKKLEATGQPLLVATALSKAAELRDRNGNSAEAIALLKQANAHYKKADSLPAQTRNKLRLAAAYQNAGLWEKSKTELQGVVTTFANMHNRPALVTSYTLLGQQAHHEGDAKKALSYFKKAKKTAKGIGSPQMIAQVELGLCDVHSKNTHLSKSRAHCGAAFTKFTTIGAWSLAARSKTLFAGVAQSQREFGEAETAYKEVLAILNTKVSPSSRKKRDLALQTANLCQVQWELKKGTAQKTCKNASALFGGLRKDDHVYNAMGVTQYALGDIAIGKKQGRTHFQEAAKFFSGAKNPVRVGDAWLRSGKLQKAPSAAVEDFNRGLAAVAADKSRIGKGVRLQLRLQLAQTRIDQKEWDRAKNAIDALIEESKNQQSHGTHAWALSARAKAYFKTGNRDGARADLAQCVKIAKKALDREQQSICEANLKKLKK